MQGKTSSRESWIAIGPWGGIQGERWAYKPTEGFVIKRIIIRHGEAVDSLIFQSEATDGSTEYSHKFGGSGGTRTDKVSIDSPAEYITAINITIGNSIMFGNFSGQDVIRSLSFVTNLTEYGPFGKRSGTFISTVVENGVMVGFHGRAGDFLNSIGFYTHSKIPCICQIPEQEYRSNQHQSIATVGLTPSVTPPLESINAMNLLSPRDPGPWGGPAGNKWDDGVLSAVQKVHLYIGHGAIYAIQLGYMKRDGEIVWFPKHGGSGGELVEVDCLNEVLIGIEGHYGPVEGRNGIGKEEAITSISLYTNRGKYGPFGGGNESCRSYFISGLSGKVVGFFGRSTENYLTAIGLHMEYF
ncbi:hypothetical protein Vadar_005935 [Vaccinium darrowii]|uniref:Uncharacterized protein n=1 Tax=Vaccinium darrowii TaxID=229202 RepID=A0ACB7Y6I2_9ERIC|nr:hypothetical protein Vadar_005935 [Vaccinium darrowii]